MRMVRTMTLAVAVLGTVAASAQDEPRATSSRYLSASKKADVTVPFAITAEGRRFEPTWGLDLAWINEQNLRKGVNHMLKENVGIGRSSFRVLNPLKGDTALTSDQIAGLRERSNLFNTVVAPTLPLVLNCDNGYRPDGHTGSNINTYYTKNKRANVAHWAAAIAAHVAWMQKNTKHPVAGVSPFNEPDYDTNELAQGTAADERDVAKYLKQNYQDVLGEAVIAGGNTLNNDKALTWYNTGKQYYDWGNTHQLAGSFDNFARFFQQVAKDGKVGYDDEMHNTVEAMVGLEYGMTVGIWWGFDSRTRGEFCQISRHGERLAYGEHRNNWTAASVWRHDDGRVKAFIGSSERQGATTSYQFVSKDRDVYYDGYGPVRELTMEIPGGTGYQTGQTNAECVIDVTWGEDVQPMAIADGTYQFVNKATGNVAAVSGDNIVMQKRTGSKLQQWNITRVSPRIGGDYSFYEFKSANDNKTHMNLLNFSTADGANIMAYSQNAKPDVNEQWYLEYVGDGYYHIRCRESALYLTAASGSTNNGTNIVQNKLLTADAAHNRQLWRILPADVVYDTEAPSVPGGLQATSHSASVTLTWTANDDEDLSGYMVLRAAQGTDEWNTIARVLTTNSFTDNTCRQDVSYIYKVKAIDRSQNFSAASETIEAKPVGRPAMIARWQMEDNTQDDTDNMMDAVYYGSPKFVDGRETGQKALRLSGSASQYVQLPYEVAGSDELTVAMWVYLRSASNWQRLFDFGYDTDHYLFLSPSNGSVMRFGIKNGGDEQTLSCQPLPTSQWKHVAVTIGKDNTTIYVDGEPLATSQNITIRPSDIRPMLNYIGRSQFTADPFLTADIDDVCIYNFAASSDEVRCIMNNQAMPGDVNEDGTVDEADVSATIGYLLGLPTEHFSKTAADMNRDNNVDITDVTAIITAILNE